MEDVHEKNDQTPLVEYINPHKAFIGIFIPNWLLDRQELSLGAKVVYGIMCRLAGKTGICRARQEVIRKAIGLKDRQTREYIKELEDFCLIDNHKGGGGWCNEYKFRRHDWMSDFRTDRQDSAELSTYQTGGKAPVNSAGKRRSGRRDSASHYKGVVIEEANRNTLENKDGAPVGAESEAQEKKIDGREFRTKCLESIASVCAMELRWPKKGESKKLDPNTSRIMKCLEHISNSPLASPTPELIVEKYERGLMPPCWWYDLHRSDILAWKAQKNQRPTPEDISTTWGVWPLDEHGTRQQTNRNSSRSSERSEFVGGFRRRA